MLLRQLAGEEMQITVPKLLHTAISRVANDFKVSRQTVIIMLLWYVLEGDELDLERARKQFEAR